MKPIERPDPYEEVMMALLTSSCRPGQAVISGLQAVVDFVLLEHVKTDAGDLASCIVRIYERAQKTGLPGSPK